MIASTKTIVHLHNPDEHERSSQWHVQERCYLIRVLTTSCSKQRQLDFVLSAKKQV